MIVVLFSKVWTIIFLTFDVIEWNFLNEIFSIPCSSSFYFRVFFSWFCFYPFFVCVSVVYPWVSFCSCWLYCLVKCLSFKLWSVCLSVCFFGDWWNDWTLSSFVESHWFFSLCWICLIISLRNVFLVINGTLIKFPMFWN